LRPQRVVVLNANFGRNTIFVPAFLLSQARALALALSRHLRIFSTLVQHNSTTIYNTERERVELPNMKISTALFTLLISILSPKVCDAVFCAIVTPILASALDGNSCTCGYRWRIFWGFGIKLSCDVTFEGADANIAARIFAHHAIIQLEGEIEYKAGQTADASVEFRFNQGAILPFHYNAEGCTMTVGGEECDECTITGDFPLPEFTFDCDNVT
jgi:hypothetical protein